MRTRPILIAMALLLVGCGGAEKQPDPDGERGGAKELFFDKLTDDFISKDKNDLADWKFFKIKNRGILRITVYWDNKGIRSDIKVRDRFGALLDSRRHSSELEKDVLEVRVEPGTHFIELRTDRGGSVYTMEAVFERFDFKPDDDFRPEAVAAGGDLLGLDIPDDGKTAPVRTRTRTRTRSRSRSRGDDKPKPRTRSRSRDDGFSGASLKANIIRLVKTRSGKGTILTINKGESAGVRIGSRGVILDDDGNRIKKWTFRITKASAKTSSGEVSAKKGTIGQRRRVRVYLK